MQRSCKSLFGLVAVGCMIQGCSTAELKSKKVALSTSNTPVPGIVYYLPKSQFTVKTSYVIKECRKMDPREPGYDENLPFTFNYDEKAVIDYKAVNDLSNAYVIELNTFNKATKESKIEMEMHENGMIKSINNSMSDKTAEVSSNIAKTAGKVLLYATAPEAALIAGIASSTKDLISKELIPLCSSDVNNSLHVIDDLKSNLEKAQESVKEHIKIVERCKDDNASDKCMTFALNDLYKAEHNMTKIQKQYDNNMSALTIEATATFTDFNKTIKPTKKALKDKISSDYHSHILKKLTRNFLIENAIKREPSIDKEGANGILYIQPALATIKVCQSNNPKCSLVKEGEFIPGVGVLATLPFTNKTGQSNSLQASFNDKGMLTKVMYSSNASAEVVSGIALDLAKEYENYVKQKAEMQYNETQGEIAEVKQGVDLLTSLKELQKLKEDSGDLETLQYQIDMQTKLNELEKLKAVDTAYEELVKSYEHQKMMSNIETLEYDDATRKLNTEKLKLEIEKIRKEMESS